jgi:hypothetical protein
MPIPEIDRVRKSVGLLQATSAEVTNEYQLWMSGVLTDRSIQTTKICGGIGKTLEKLLPLNQGRYTKVAFLPCIGGWTAVYDNSALGTDPSKIRVLARRLDTMGLRVVRVPHSSPERGQNSGRLGALILEAYFGTRDDFRSVWVANDGFIWEFGQAGEPFEFECTDAYARKSIRSRFTVQLMDRYLSHLGLAPFDDAFFLANECGMMCSEH